MQMLFRRLSGLLLVGSLLLPAVSVLGQGSQGQIGGRVTDPSGAPVTGAAVTLTPTITGGTATNGTLTNGTLPTGLTVGANGTITGNPSQVGTFANLKVRVRVAGNNVAIVAGPPWRTRKSREVLLDAKVSLRSHPAHAPRASN